ncbi:hypothetical protein DJ031_04660 [bacterium endosymbiont of Escarpia laminata]|nr:MAG: hypothetical protein DJ031_04660 [bacterium endosymbiont of Escarpia laminata]
MPDRKAKYILEAEDRTKLALKKAERNFKSFGSSITKMIGPLAVLGSGAALTGLVSQSFRAADAIGKMADKTGLSTDSLQEYQFAAERSGMSTELLNNNMTAFVKRVGEAKQGTGALVTFLKKYDQQLLESIKNSKSQEEALNLIADAIKKADSATERAAIANAAFSRSGIGMVNMLRDGSAGLDEFSRQAQDAGVVLEESLIRKAERINDRWDTLVSTIGTSLQTAVLNTISFIGGISDITKLESQVGGLKNKLDDLNDGIAVYQTRIDELKALDNDALTPAIAALEKGLKSAQDEAAKLQNRIDELTGKKPAPSAGDTGDDKPDGSQDKLKKRFESALSGMHRQIALLDATTKHEQTLWEVQNGRFKDLSDQQKQALLDAAKAADQRKQEIDALTAQKRAAADANVAEQVAMEDAAKAAADYNRTLESQAQTWRDQINPVNSLQRQMEELDLLLEKGKISWETYSEAMLQVTDEMDAVGEKSEETADKMSEFAVQAARNMENVFADGFFDIMQGNFDDMGSNFKSTIDRMVADLLASQLLEYLMGSFGTTGEMGGVFGSLISSLFHTGGIAGTGSQTRAVPALAFAGAPRYHTGAIAGLRSNEVPAILERGEEVLTKNDPRHRNNGGGGTVNLTLNINNPKDAQSFMQNENQLGREAVRQLDNWRMRNT